MLSAVRELGYRRNAVARNLRRAQTTLWAVIISDIGNPFFTSMVRGIEDVAQTAGYSVVLCNSDEDPDKEATYIAAALTEQMAGVIISSSRRPKAAQALVESGTPVVAIDRELPGADVDTVLVANERGAVSGTRHLLDAGYGRVACITGPEEVSTARQRADGYRRALAENGIPIDPELIYHADFREHGGFVAMGALLELDSRPDAVFVTNNLMTVGAMECLVERGVSVPDEMGIVGFDDIPWAHLVRPSLTTIAQPTYELGRTAARLLLDRIATVPSKPSTIVLPTDLRIRESSMRRHRRGQS
ncbi:substrate-binding domain-containing protein [Actinoallomurus sp. NPDC050550]|uniref:LacI family DNA-binding transcriptional regulator n=1 Tax=Actinoallomurus sp. NPDC050550 TaxID=3154937 RepID=UPI0033FCE294